MSNGDTPPTPDYSQSAAMAAAEAWAAAMAYRKKPCVLAPWDELPWFQPPVQKSKRITSADGIVNLLPPDPQRIAIIFSNSAAQGVNVGVGIDPNPVLNPFSGINVYGFNYPIVITHDNTPTLPQQAWYALTASGTSDLTYITISLLSWPSNGGR